MMHALERRVLLALALDPTFGVSGRVIAALGAQPQVGEAEIGFVQPLADGSVVIGGTVTRPGAGGSAVRVARYTVGGLLDTTFGGGDGFSDIIDMPLSGHPAGGAVQSDGKILIGSSRGTAMAVTRFNADGSLDTAFGGGDGVALAQGVFTDPGARDLALADDGKIIMLGQGDDDKTIVVARFTANGTLDNSFSGDGVTTITADADVAVAKQVAALPGGKVLILGEDRSPRFIFRDFPRDQEQVDFREPLLVRLDPGGALDSTFDGDGVRRFRFGDLPPDEFPPPGQPPREMPTRDSANALLVDGDKIVVGGVGWQGDEQHAAIARFDSAGGAFDTTFGGGDGVVFAAGSAEPGAVANIAIDSQHRYVAALGDSRFFRVSNAGAPDTSFGANDIAQIDVRGGGPLAIDLADDEILTADDAFLHRLTEDARPGLVLGANRILIITNQTGNNTITVAQAGSNLAVTRNGTTTNFPADGLLGFDVLFGNGNDSLAINVDGRANVVLGNGANTLVLGAGNHTVMGGSGPDDVSSDGAGDMEIIVGGGADKVTLLGSGSHSVDAGEDATDSANDTVTTGDGLDDIRTGGGDDVIDAGDGQNGVSSGAGDDSVTGGAGPDAFGGGDGDDTLVGGAGDDLLAGGDGNDTLLGGAGDDQLYGWLAGPPGRSDDATGNNVLDGGDGNDYLVGAAGRDSLRGGAQKDILIGSAGSDLLSGGGGKDKLAGGAGADRLYGGNANDNLDGGNGNDRLSGQGGHDKLGGGNGLDRLFGNDGDDRFFIRDGLADTVDGGAGDNIVMEFDDDSLDDILNASQAG